MKVGKPSMSKLLIKILLIILRFLIYLLQPLSFILLMSINNPQLLVVNRTSSLTLFMFPILMVLFFHIYDGFDIGIKKSKPIIYSMSTAIVLVDIIVYLQVQIMNVNDMNREYLQLFGIDIILLSIVIATQIVLITLAAYLGNMLYFMVNPPKSCCIISSGYGNLSNITRKLNCFNLQYKIREQIKYDDPDILNAIERNQLVFFFDVPAKERAKLVEHCYKYSIGMYYVPDVYDIISNSSVRHIIDDIPLLGKAELKPRLINQFLKRTLDLLITIPITVLLSPFMLIIALLIKLNDRGPIFYRQNRLTRDAKEFMIYKFRSMNVDAEKDGIARLAQENDNRITPVGKFLRRTRIDELPQLLNILSGDMSLVGPRPERPEIACLYEEFFPEFSLRLKAKAGLTGFAQVFGKYNTTPKDKLLFDLFYIETQSIWLDLNVLFKTVVVVFRKDATEEIKSHQIHAGVDNLEE